MNACCLYDHTLYNHQNHKVGREVVKNSASPKTPFGGGGGGGISCHFSRFQSISSPNFVSFPYNHTHL